MNGKLENQVRLLLVRARANGISALRETAVRIRALQKKLQHESEMDSVRGIEGYSARLYYAVFNNMLKTSEFEFTGRNRRPPRDPVNAMLSFVYTLFTNEVLSAVKAAGLDPYLDSLHSIAPTDVHPLPATLLRNGGCLPTVWF